jgi:hypothetical protein
MIKEALSMNDDIVSCGDFNITKEGSLVTINFRVNTIYGGTDITKEVEI